jgi:hypothetical protein
MQGTIEKWATVQGFMDSSGVSIQIILNQNTLTATSEGAIASLL